MKIGMLARADNTGLGIQTYDFYRHIKPEKVLVVDLQHLNGLQTDINKYPGSPIVKYTPYPAMAEGDGSLHSVFNEFLDGLDLLFSCETFYDYYLISEARRRGIRTILQYNFELLDHLQNPHVPQPDLFMAPSCWRYDDVQFNNKIFIPVPVDTNRFPYQHRTSAKTFLHLAGNATLEDRNGTLSLINSWQQVKSGADLLIQSPHSINHHGSNIRVDNTYTVDNTDLYRTGDVLVMPRKYGGLSLPLNEALALGMPVIMTNLCPQHEFLPSNSLIPATLSKQVTTKTSINVYEVNQNDLAAKIDELVDNPGMVSSLSEQSGELAQLISWKRLAPVYQKVFEAVMDGVTPPDLFTWPDSRLCTER